MTFSVELRTKTMKRRPRSSYEVLPDHLELRERLRKTLYYGKLPETDRPSLPMTEAAVDVFQEVAPRGLGKLDTHWASSIGRRACVSPCSLMLGMLYLDRLKNKNPEYLQKVSSSELFLVSMMVASKYLFDEGVDEEVFNDEWAESAKMDVEDLNELERDFLAAIDWSLFVKPEDFTDSLLEMEKRIARLKGLEQGYYMYSDLMVLSDDARFLTVCRHLLQEFCKVVMVCSVAYFAGVLTIVGSSFALSGVRSNFLQTPPPASSILPMLPDIEPTQTSNISVAEVAEEHVDEALARQGVTAVPSVEEEAPSQKPLGIQASGLLTLTLLKDTLLHFVLGIKQQWKNDDGTDDRTPSSRGFHENSTDTSHATRKCACHHCPGKKKSMKQNTAEAFKANRSELNKDVTKTSVGKLPIRCSAHASPAKHGTELETGSGEGRTLPKVCRLPQALSYQMVAPLGADVATGFRTMAKAITV